MLYIYFKLNALLDNNPQIKTVYLGVYYDSFAAYYDDFTYRSDVSSNYFLILPSKQQFTILSDFRMKNYNLITKSILNGFNSIITKRRVSFIGNSFTYSSKIELSNTTIQETIDQIYYKKDNYNDFSFINIEYFVKIIDLLSKKNISLVVLNSPTYYLHDKKIPQHFKDFYLKIMNANRLNVVNFNNLLQNESYYMPDEVNINQQVADIITNYLNNVQKIIIISSKLKFFTLKIISNFIITYTFNASPF